MLTIGIETSCDDTSIAIIRGESKVCPPEVLSFTYFTQETLLAKWGGVVPEIAARNHLMKLAPLIDQALKEAKVEMDEIDLIGVTTNPGLLGPLLTGLNSAKTLAMIYKKPIVAVNHLYAHLEAIHLSEENFTYPYLGLLVSGGHSLYLLVNSPTEFEILGSTIDDAAGEAFDKGGKLLGLGYPAGRIIDERAKKGDATKFTFPIGMKSSGDARLSFSGVKTSLRQFTEKNPDYQDHMDDVCASYQKAIVDALMLKLRYAYQNAKEKTGVQNLPIVLGGGVACNSALRAALKKKYPNSFHVLPKYCTDNGAMIANYAFRIEDQRVEFPKCLEMDARGRFVDKNQMLNEARKS